MLLGQSIDYAGVFPPAQLPLVQALENYAAFKHRPEAWLLGRFVCPIDQLRTIAANESLIGTEKTICVSVVGTASDGMTQLLYNLLHDVQLLVEFIQAHGTFAKVEALELKLPTASLLPETNLLEKVLKGTSITAAKLPALHLFMEVPAGPDWQQRVSGLLQVIQAGGYGNFGLKIRLGGLAESDMPSPEQVAFFIEACRKAGVRWKATAGLHHPISDPDLENNDSQFGFLNLFAASVLGWVHALNQAQITAILKATSISDFSFDESSFSFGDHHVTLAEIEQGRGQSLASIGSCSFDEPCAGLRQLQLIV
jgi:hypothetical protein